MAATKQPKEPKQPKTVVVPRGIQTIERETPTGLSIRYRVRVIRKKFKRDKYFDNLADALNYLQYTKTNEGIAELPKFDEEEKARMEEMDKIMKAPLFKSYVDTYQKRYIDTKQQITELEKRNVKNVISFLTTIKNTKVDIALPVGGVFALGGFSSVKKALGDFKLQDITPIIINNYITARLQSVKKISIAREITHISRVFSKLKYIDPDLSNVINPTTNYDRDLLLNRDVKRQYILTDDEEIDLELKLKKYRNRQMYLICMASLKTGMRRSEILTLKKNQLFLDQNFIQLWHTKTNNPRKVYITEEAKLIFQEAFDKAKGENLFNYKITGFEGSFVKWKNENGFEHMRFHDLRRTFISRFLMTAGAENSVLIAELLGITSIRKFEENHVRPLAPKPHELAKSVGNSGEQHKRYVVIQSKRKPV